MNPVLKSGSMLLLAFLMMATARLSAQDLTITQADDGKPPALGEILEWKEIFTYEVKYSFFRLGQVRIEVVGDTLYGGRRAWWLRSIITSNSSIPFVGTEENHYNSLVAAGDSMPYTLLYWRDNVDEEEYGDSRYEFDYDSGRVFVHERDEEPDTLELDGPASSGQLILLYSRLFAGSTRSYELPVYLEKEKGYIRADNSRSTELREYEAFDQPVPSYYSEGHADVNGPFGFNGDFKAWFLADELRVPLEAHVRVWLGNVKVRLIDYQKTRRQ